MKKIFLFFWILVNSLVLLLFSCQKDDAPIIKEKLTGFVQKGPFVNGTSIMISELDHNLVQTGKNFSTQIIDNRGSFELKGISFESRYVELKADGFYFNEILGKTSTAQLTLYALTDLSARDNVNVNVLSHLEKQRIQYLISKGITFEQAKNQAQGEILKIFEISMDNIGESESLDISCEGDDNAILLAVSVILQGYRTDAQFSELLATIAGDLREDGLLDNAVTGSALINHTKYMNMSTIRKNLENRYKELTGDAVIPAFEKFLHLFIDSTNFEFTHFINYPQWSDYGENILYEGLNAIHKGDYSMAAELPAGSELKVILSGGLWAIRVAPNGPINWNLSQYDFNKYSQVFKTIDPGKDCDLLIHFMIDEWVEDSLTQVTDTIKVEFYENNSEQPTKIKKLFVSGVK